jgi:hypothetical protein
MISRRWALRLAVSAICALGAALSVAAISSAAKTRTPSQQAAASCKKTKGSSKRAACVKRKLRAVCKAATNRKHRDCAGIRKRTPAPAAKQPVTLVPLPEPPAPPLECMVGTQPLPDGTGCTEPSNGTFDLPTDIVNGEFHWACEDGSQPAWDDDVQRMLCEDNAAALLVPGSAPPS